MARTVVLALCVAGALGGNTVLDFSGGLEGWVASQDAKYAGSEWSAEGGALRVVAPHKFYGLSRALEAAVAPGAPGGFVVQYEVKLAGGVTCSGSYLKLLAADAAFEGSKLKESSPYAIMFGPDNCGHTSKVHFILRQQNPATKAWEEKHMSALVVPLRDRASHLYTLELRADNSFSVRVDGEEKAAGNLLKDDDFKPPFATAAEIDDPADKKPADWVDTERIPDAAAVKPADWDEEAPQKIPDPDASKPAGWVDSAPLEIPDPDARKPEDWSDEDDGAWEAPIIKNPACAVGCGAWQRPLIANPAYKGKWQRPMVPNPAYKGAWKPRRIANPGFFAEPNPIGTIPEVGAIAIEILANDKDITFDSLIIGDDIEAARAWASDVFLAKQAKEKAEDKTEQRVAAKVAREKGFEEGGAAGALNWAFGEASDKLQDLTGVDDEYKPHVFAAAILALALALLVPLVRWCLRSPPDDAALAKKSDESRADEEEEEEEEEEEQQPAAAKPAGGAADEDEDEEPEADKTKGRPEGLQRRIPKAN
jgi:calnexin